MNKFLVIGKSNTGKSCLMDEIIEKHSLRPVGFRMHSFAFENEFKGYYMSSIKDVEGYHNNVPIQTVLKSKHRINHTEVYDTFGVLCLKDVLKMKKKEYVDTHTHKNTCLLLSFCCCVSFLLRGSGVKG